MARKMRRVRISVDEPVRLPEGILHTGTSYWISRTIDFINALVFVENDIVNLRENYFDIELDDTEPVYIKTQYVYNDGASLSNQSRISSLRSNQEGIHISDAIVNTPKLELSTDYSNDSNGELTLTGSEFKMFTSVGILIATTWIIKDIHGNILYSKERDAENLNSIKLPNTINKNTNFIAEMYYHTDTNVVSNAGKFFNLVENKKTSLFTVDKIGRLIVGRPLYFKINLKTIKFKSYSLTIKDLNGSIIKVTTGLIDLAAKVNTSAFNVGESYTFEFKLDLGNEYSDIVKITDVASNQAVLYDPNKTYLNQYDYRHLLFMNGKTTQLSYQLYNDAVLLTRNGDKSISLYQPVNEYLIRIGDIFDLPVDKIIDLPGLFVQELYNGDVLVSYISRDDADYGTIYLAVYDFNPVTNNFILKHKRSLNININIVTPGAITTTWDNKIHYVSYDTEHTPKLNTYDVYTDELVTIDIPVIAKANVSIVRDNYDNILIVGGTNTHNTIGNTIYGVRDNDKVLVFNTLLKTFNEVGVDIMSGINTDLHSFHSVLRHDGSIILFNTLDNGNIAAIDNQSTIVINVASQSATLLTNDHVDDLPYLCTVVLNNGDILRFSSLTKDPQKLYNYISNTMDGGRLDDNNNVIRNSNELIVLTNEIITEDYIKNYDIVRVEGDGILKLVKNTETLIFDSSCLILTRDTVLYRSEFDAGNWSQVVLVECELIIKDIDNAFI